MNKRHEKDTTLTCSIRNDFNVHTMMLINKGITNRVVLIKIAYLHTILRSH